MGAQRINQSFLKLLTEGDYMNKFYTVPTVDISNDTFRQTVVDCEEGLYLGHPTTVLLDDGKTIVTVYPKNHGCGQIVLKMSRDGGITWSGRLLVPASFSSSLEVPTIFKLTDKNGIQRLVMFSGLYPIRMSFSSDNGVTWSELEPIGDYGGIVAMGDIVCTAPGEYMALFHDDGRFISGGIDCKFDVFRAGKGEDMRSKVRISGRDDDGSYNETDGFWRNVCDKPGDRWEHIYTAYSANEYADGHFVLYAVTSKDGGLTWSEPHAICSHGGGAQLCEPCIVRSPDGKKLAVLLRENSRKFNSFIIISDDNGETWSQPAELPAALTGDRHCAKYLKDGRLFISFRDTTHISPTKGDWVAWVGTFDDIISGREGQYRVRIMKNYGGCDCAYPGVEVLPDGTVVTTTYGHFTDGKKAYIVSVRVKPSELDALLP